MFAVRWMLIAAFAVAAVHGAICSPTIHVNSSGLVSDASETMILLSTDHYPFGLIGIIDDPEPRLSVQYSQTPCDIDGISKRYVNLYDDQNPTFAGEASFGWEGPDTVSFVNVFLYPTANICFAEEEEEECFVLDDFPPMIRSISVSPEARDGGYDTFRIDVDAIDMATEACMHPELIDTFSWINNPAVLSQHCSEPRAFQLQMDYVESLCRYLDGPLVNVSLSCNITQDEMHYMITLGEDTLYDDYNRCTHVFRVSAYTDSIKHAIFVKIVSSTPHPRKREKQPLMDIYSKLSFYGTELQVTPYIAGILPDKTLSLSYSDVDLVTKMFAVSGLILKTKDPDQVDFTFQTTHPFIDAPMGEYDCSGLFSNYSIDKRGLHMDLTFYSNTQRYYEIVTDQIQTNGTFECYGVFEVNGDAYAVLDVQISGVQQMINAVVQRTFDADLSFDYSNTVMIPSGIAGAVEIYDLQLLLPEGGGGGGEDESGFSSCVTKDACAPFPFVDDYECEAPEGETVGGIPDALKLTIQCPVCVEEAITVTVIDNCDRDEHRSTLITFRAEQLDRAAVCAMANVSDGSFEDVNDEPKYYYVTFALGGDSVFEPLQFRYMLTEEQVQEACDGLEIANGRRSVKTINKRIVNDQFAQPLRYLFGTVFRSIMLFNSNPEVASALADSPFEEWAMYLVALEVDAPLVSMIDSQVQKILTYLSTATEVPTTMLPTETPVASPTASTVIPTSTESATTTATPSSSSVLPTPTESSIATTTASYTATPTETSTVAPTETPTQAPTEAPTQAPTQAPTDAPTQAPTDAPTQAPTQAPTTPPINVPTAEPLIAINMNYMRFISIFAYLIPLILIALPAGLLILGMGLVFILL